MQARSLLVVMLVVVVAVAAWFAFGNQIAPDLPAVPAAADATGPRAANAQTAVAAADAEAPAAAPVAAMERTLVPPVAAAAVAGSTYRVRGRLVDRLGAPRAQAKVRCHTWSATGDDTAAAAIPEAVSAADGGFAFDVLHGRDGNLNLGDDELVFASDGRVQFESGDGDRDLGDLVVVRTAVLQGLVQDELGRAVADVVVDATDGVFAFGVQSRTKTGADGTFAIGKLRPGTWRLRAASARFLPTTLEVTLAAEERHEGIVLVVRPGNAVAGQVVDDRNVGVAGGKVGSHRKETTGAMAIERFSAEEATTTDANGFFTLAGLGEGTVTIRAFGAGHTGATLADVPIGTGNLVLRVQRLAAIEGVLVDTKGVPLAGSKVSASSKRRGWDGIDAMPLVQHEDATTAADGTFRLESVEPGTVVVAARGQGHLPANQTGVRVEPGQTVRGVRLVAEAGATVRASVVTADGAPVAGARVTAGRPGGRQRVMVAHEDDEPWSDGAATIGSATTDAAGLALVRGLPPGDLEFGAEHAAYAAAPKVNCTVPASGTGDVELVLAEPGFVAVHVIDVGGAVAVGRDVRITQTVDGSDGATQSSTTGADGRVRFGPLAPGAYSATIVRRPDQQQGGDAMFSFGDDERGIGASRQPFTIVAGETTALELRMPVVARLHGTVLGVDGPVAGCTVELERRGEASSGWTGFGPRSVQSGKDGEYVFDEVEAGTYTLAFGRRTQRVMARQDVDVLPNVAHLRQDLQLHTGRIALHVHEVGTGNPLEGAEVELVRADAGGTGGSGPTMVMAMIASIGEGGEAMTVQIGGRAVKSDRDGGVVIDDVPVGTYTVHVTHVGHEAVDKSEQVVVERQTTDCGRIELGPAKAK